MMARFRNFYNLRKSQDLVSKKRSAFRTGAKIYFSETNILGLGALTLRGGGK